jgi:hypothetical protein
MADQLNTEEFQRLLEITVDYMKRGIPLTEAQTKALIASTKAEQDHAAAQSAAFNKLSRGTRELGQAMMEGKRGMEAMNGGVDAIAGALQFASTLLPGMRLFGKALSAAVGMLGFFIKETNKQADALFKTYQDLSKSGQATAGGMVDVYKNMQQFGYNIEELGKMASLLKENSQALADFGGTAAAGGKAFADAAQQIQYSDLGTTFRKLGMMPDEVNRGMAMYIKSQQAIGMRSTDINKNLADSAGKYVMQMDLLAKLTGLSAEQQQEKMDQANAEEAFNQVQFELQRKANAGDAAAKEQLIQNEILNKTLTGTALKEFQQGVGGDISAFSKTMMTSSEAAGMMASGSFKASDVLNSLGKGSEQFRMAYGNLARMNAAGFGLPPAERSRLESRYADQTAGIQEERAKAEQDLQKNGLEPTTASMVNLQTAQMNTTKSFQSLVNIGVAPATSALSGLAEAGALAAGAILPSSKNTLPGTIGGGGGVTAPAGAAPPGGAAGPAPKSAPGASGGASMTQGGLAALGLKLRPSGGDIQAEGAGISNNLISLAQNVQKSLPGFSYFSGFNDNYHLREAPNSKHTQGRALDFALGQAPTKEEGARLVATLKSMGANYARDEYNDPSSKSTAGHIHAEVSARDGFKGLLTGPSGGYRPNIEMHGREQLSITPANAGSTANLMGAESSDMMKKQLEKLDQMVQGINQSSAQDIMTMQLSRLDELVRVMQNQVNVSTKILQQSR